MNSTFPTQEEPAPDGQEAETGEKAIIMLENDLYERTFHKKNNDNSNKYRHLDGSF